MKSEKQKVTPKGVTFDGADNGNRTRLSTLARWHNSHYTISAYCLTISSANYGNKWQILTQDINPLFLTKNLDPLNYQNQL